MKYGLPLGIIASLILTASSPIFCADVDESALFEEMQISANIRQQIPSSNTNLLTYTNERSVNFSGQLNFEADGFSPISVSKKKSLIFYTDSDLLMDIRMQKGIKAFLDLNLIYSSSPLLVQSASANMLVGIKEFFVDFNLDNRLYVRSGKQFIKWGTTYFWNPVDFINKTQKNFLALDAIRTGVSGVRFHIPEQANQNIYFFLNMDSVGTLDQLSLASKYEWLMGSTELSISMWNQSQSASQYGLELSTNFSGLDIKSELALTSQTQTSKLIIENNTMTIQKQSGQWFPRWTLNLGKAFNWERSNRIMTNYEFYYNGQGYSEKILDNPIQRQFLLGNMLYEANQYAKWYHAFFISINEFPSHSTQTNLNILQNLMDYSGIASLGITYMMVDGLKLTGSASYFFGDPNSEYLLNGNRIMLKTSAVVTF